MRLINIKIDKKLFLLRIEDIHKIDLDYKKKSEKSMQVESWTDITK